MSFWMRRRRREDDLSQELRSHLEMAERDRIERGQNPAQARAAARREFGNLSLVKEVTRQMWGLASVEHIVQDVFYGWRMWRRNPAFSALVIGLMALGIGVNTAMFSLVYSLMLTPAPYPDARHLVLLKEQLPQIGEGRLNTSPAEYLDYRDRNRVFQSVAGYEQIDLDLTGAGAPERISGVRSTHNLFATLEIGPQLGRVFTSADDRYGAPPVVVLSDAFWQTHFGRDPGVLGRSLRLDERTYTIIGVMAGGFTFPSSHTSLDVSASVWIPMSYPPAEIADRAASYDTSVIARLKPGRLLGDAAADVNRIAEDFEREHREIYTGNVHVKPILEALGEEESTRLRPALFALMAAVALVLLIACADAANLLLARGLNRQREAAVRSALGAGTARMFRQLTTESLLLTVSGGFVGCFLAYLLLSLTIRLAPPDVATDTAVRLNLPVLFFTLLLSGLTGLLCGLAPAFQALKPDLIYALRGTARGSVGSRGENRLRLSLVSLEAAAAVVLLVGAALLGRSLVAALEVPPGFNSHGVTVVRTSFNAQRYGNPARRHQAEREILEKLSRLPNVSAAALTTHIPLADERKIGFVVDGQDPNEYHWAMNALVSDSYFEAMGIPLLRGRRFDSRDVPDAPIAALINQAMSQRYWPQQDPLGKRVLWGGRTLTIMGVVGDVHLQALELSPAPTLYNSVFQVESGASANAVFVIRSQGEQGSPLSRLVRQAIWSVDSGVPVFASTSMDEIVARSLASRRFAVVLLVVFSAIALLLAALGLYGVLSYAVTQRMPEFGLRLALGAAGPQLISGAVGEALRAVSLGLVSGLILAGILSSALSRLLFGVRPLDLPSFAGAALVLLAAATFASLRPALRALRVDPAIALRWE